MRGLDQPNWNKSLIAWFLICLGVRWFVLVVLPFGQSWFLDRDRPAQMVANRSTLPAVLDWLNHRVAYHPLTEDEHCYDEMALNLLAGRGFVIDSLFVLNDPGKPTTFLGCGYPLFLAGCYGVFGHNQLLVFLLQGLLQALGLLALMTGVRRLLGALTAHLAAAYFTFNPTCIWVSNVLMTEALALPLCLVFGATMIGWLSDPSAESRYHAISIGLLLGVLGLVRSSAGVFLLFALVAAIIKYGIHAYKRIVLYIFLAGAATLLVVLPWTLRNYSHFHALVFLSSKSGLNAWGYNHPGLKVSFSNDAIMAPLSVDSYDKRIRALPNEIERDHEFWRLAKGFIAEHPATFLGLCTMRLGMNLLPVRITSTTRSAWLAAFYAKGLQWLLLLILVGSGWCRTAAFGSFLRRLRFPLICILLWMGMQSIAGPGLRFRLPVEPFWAVLIGGLGAEVVTHLFSQPLESRKQR